MTVRHPLLLAALAGLFCLGVAACDGSDAPRSDKAADQAAAAAPPPSANAAAPEPTASVMRPSVVNEVAPAPPPPPPEPFEATVHFDEGGAILSDQAKEILARVAAVAGQSSDRPIILRGHTDSQGNDADNKRMSELRAEAVRDWLAEHGVAAERMTVIGLGEARPVAPNATLSGEIDEEGRRQNRRVDIVIEPPKAQEPIAPAEQPKPEPAA